MSCDSSIADLTMEMLEEDCREELLSHIKELHEAVVEMKSAFTVAQLQLQNVSMDEEALKSVKSEVEGQRTDCERQSANMLQLIMALKGEVTCVKEALQSTQFVQHGLQSSLHTVMMERDLLLDELGKSGAISEHLRVRLYSGLNGSIFPRPSSGSHSHQSSANSNDNDSGVALLLEKAHDAFQPLQISTQGPSPALRLANHANVQEYLNTLAPHSHTSNPSSGSPHLQEEEEGTAQPNNARGNDGHGIVYDSDCSLTLAATKSLSLSNSLSKQCGLELNQDQNQQHSIVHLNENEKGLEVEKREQGEGSTAATSDSHSELSFKEGQRLKVAKELLETERKYCHTLKTIQHTFAYPLKKLGVLNIKDINTLFPEEVFSLHEKHCILLSQLEERVASWKNQPTIGDILERFTNGGSDVLRLYTNYVNDFPEVLKTFHKLCRSSREFTQFLKSSLEHPTCGGLDLGAFLLSPVQRMPRYILLLKQIIKYTEPSHLDYKDITACLDRLRNYLKRLNDSMEHSFQLVTAQITPQPEENEHEKKIGFTNALGLGLSFGFGSRSGGKQVFARSSVCSSQSRSSRSTTHEDAEESSNSHTHKVRYRRSTSVPRSQVQAGTVDKSQHEKPHKDCGGKGKLKNKSKSDWTVCKACNCSSQNTIPPPPHKNPNTRGRAYERTLSDSDLNSDPDEENDHEKIKRKFSTSKSLHDFPHEEDHPDWFLCEPSLCEESNSKSLKQNNNVLNTTTVRNNVMVRPLTSTQPGRYVARIQRGSESEMNLHMIGMKKSLEQQKKKSSLRNSLKNIFSLKKRTTKTLQISGPILPSKINFSCDRGTPPPVATLRYNNGQECYQSLPPEPEFLMSTTLLKSNANNYKGPPSLPPAIPSQPPHLGRYMRNPYKFTNPKLPKTPFITKYHPNLPDERHSPYTDV